MKLRSVICVALLAALPFAALANKSSTVYLQGGHTVPGGEIKISSHNLFPFVHYNVVCSIRMDSPKDETSSHIQVFADDGSVQLSVNSHPLPADGQSMIAINEDNTLYATGFTATSGDIIIRNLDWDNELSVNHCGATPAG